MQRDVRLYLWDIEKSVDEIVAFTQGKLFSDYVGDTLLRAAVERKFEIIGEALVRVAHHFPEDVVRIAGYRKFIGFRNVISHQYDALDDASVWRDVELSLTDLRAQVRAWREELDVIDPITS